MSGEERRATNIRFAPEELERVQRRAARLALSVQAYVHDVVMRDVDELEARFLSAADRIIAEDAEAFAAAEAADAGVRQALRERERQAGEELARMDRQAGAA